MQRNKGAQAERKVAELYSFALDKEVYRELSQYQKKSGRDLRGCEPYVVQIKHQKRVNYRKAYEEARDGIGEGYIYPVAHIHEDYKEPLVVISEKFWLTCVEMLKGVLA